MFQYASGNSQPQPRINLTKRTNEEPIQSAVEATSVSC